MSAVSLPAVSLSSVAIVAGVLVVAPIVAWFGVYAAVLAITRPRLPQAAPATPDLGGESPAVASLLVNHWEVTEDAAESTLLDLAARHILELRQPGNDPMQTTVHIKQPQPVGLASYEQRVFDRVAFLAAGGVVPLTALTFRQEGEAAGWTRRFAVEVIAEARLAGLSRRRIGAGVVGALIVAAAAAGACVLAGAAYFLQHRHYHDTGQAAIGAGTVAFLILSGFATRPRGERDTAAGREAAARWLGVRAWLRGHDAFGDLPPAAVAVWDRYLSYGAAVGATRVSSAVIDLGMANRHNVWSAWNGGVEQPPLWHRVRVHYPHFWPRYGKSAPRLIIRAVVVGAIGYVLVRWWYTAVDKVVGAVGTQRLGGAAQYVALIKSAFVLAGSVALVYAVYVIARTAIDLATQRVVTGEVVWVEHWRTRQSSARSSATTSLSYVAIDEGSGDSTRAWVLPSPVRMDAQAGDVATVTVRRWSRRITTSQILKQGGSARLALGDLGTASRNTEQLIAGAMGLPAQPNRGAGLDSALSGTSAVPAVPSAIPAVAAAAVPSAVPAVGPLLTADEVGQALGTPVTMQAQAAPSPLIPVSVLVFRGPDKVSLLTVVRTGGVAATMAMRARRHGQIIPGLGDEARGGHSWIRASRAGEVVTLTLGGTAARTVPPATLLSLAQTAMSRMPTRVG